MKEVVADGLLEAGYSLRQVKQMLSAAEADILYLVLADDIPLEAHYTMEGAQARVKDLQDNQAAFDLEMEALNELEVPYSEVILRQEACELRHRRLFDHVLVDPLDPPDLIIRTVKMGISI